MASCSISLTALIFLLLHTLWKWPTLLHSMHILPYAGCCLGECVLPQYLHASHNGVLYCAGVLGLLAHTGLDTFIFYLLVSVIVLITAALAFGLLSSLPMLGHYHSLFGHYPLMPSILLLFLLAYFYH